MRFQAICRNGTILSAIALMVLQGCQSPPAERESVVRAREEKTIRRRAQPNDPETLARRYEQVATRSLGPARNSALLSAARLWLSAGNVEAAERLLGSVHDVLANGSLTQRILIEAEIALRRHTPEQALAKLNSAAIEQSSAYRAEALRLRAQALFETGLPTDAISIALERERLLTAVRDIDRNRALIWDWLSRGEFAELTPGSSGYYGDTLRGWIALNHAAKLSLKNAFSAQVEIDDWRHRFPRHPANEFLVDKVLPELKLRTTFPPSLALILPLTGGRNSEAEAVRDGFIAALLRSDQRRRPHLTVYDSEADGVLAAYRRAVADGANFVVGPLLKESVAALIESNEATVPTLMLNYSTEQTSTAQNVFRFWLDPSEEASQIASRAAALGLLSGVALLPDNERGRRVRDAFDAELQRRGGSLVGTRFYDTDAKDFDSPVRELLLIDESRQRIARLKAALRTNFESELRPRGDVNFVFIGGNALHGRMFRSMIEFYFNQSMPTFATSNVFDPQADNNRDLNGVSFPDMPWLIAPDSAAENLRRQLEAVWPDRLRLFPRLFAFGFDACQLIPLLTQGKNKPMPILYGLTGRLSIGNTGSVHRQLQWAQVERGEIVPMDTLFWTAPVLNHRAEGSNAESPPLSQLLHLQSKDVLRN